MGLTAASMGSSTCANYNTSVSTATKFNFHCGLRFFVLGGNLVGLRLVGMGLGHERESPPVSDFLFTVQSDPSHSLSLSAVRDNRSNLMPVQHYLIVWNFPTVKGSWDACPSFAGYINGGGAGDHFEGFELKYRVCDPIGGKGMAIAVATDLGKVWAHLAPWIEGFGIHFDVTPVVSDAEFASMWPGVRASAASA